MELGLILFVALVFLGAFAFAVYSHVRAHEGWKSHPTMEQYLAEHPECKTARGLKCAKCGSGSIKNWGLSRSDDSRRLFICNHCGKTLYRSA
jgi:hypothetical protein